MHSATATFFAPSDPSGIGGMHREVIQVAPSWRNSDSRYDCVFVETDQEQHGMRGLHVAQIHLFFSFFFNKKLFSCALIHWFEKMDINPDPLTGMWVVEQDFQGHTPFLEVIHVNSTLYTAHLIPVYGDDYVPNPKMLRFSQSLDYFKRFYVNKYIDHHAHEIAF